MGPRGNVQSSSERPPPSSGGRRPGSLASFATHMPCTKTVGNRRSHHCACWACDSWRTLDVGRRQTRPRRRGPFGVGAGQPTIAALIASIAFVQAASKGLTDNWRVTLTLLPCAVAISIGTLVLNSWEHRSCGGRPPWRRAEFPHWQSLPTFLTLHLQVGTCQASSRQVFLRGPPAVEDLGRTAERTTSHDISCAQPIMAPSSPASELPEEERAPRASPLANHALWTSRRGRVCLSGVHQARLGLANEIAQSVAPRPLSFGRMAHYAFGWRCGRLFGRGGRWRS